jgi:hypothetical protein
MGVIFEVDRLKKQAQVLRDILLKYEDQEKEAKNCLQLLDPIIQKVLDGKITEPLLNDGIPCGYSFAEGELRPIPGMHDAFANFAVHIRGHDTDEGREWFAEMEKEIENEKQQEKPHVVEK